MFTPRILSHSDAPYVLSGQYAVVDPMTVDTFQKNIPFFNNYLLKTNTVKIQLTLNNELAYFFTLPRKLNRTMISIYCTSTYRYYAYIDGDSSIKLNGRFVGSLDFPSGKIALIPFAYFYSHRIKGEGSIFPTFDNSLCYCCDVDLTYHNNNLGLVKRSFSNPNYFANFSSYANILLLGSDLYNTIEINEKIESLDLES